MSDFCSTGASYSNIRGLTPAASDASLFSVLSCPSSPIALHLKPSYRERHDRFRAGSTKVINDLRKENFSLRLQVCLLERKIAQAPEKDMAEVLNENVKLHVELQSLKNELESKAQILEKTIEIAHQNETSYKEAEKKISYLEQQMNEIKEGHVSEEYLLSAEDSVDLMVEQGQDNQDAKVIIQQLRENIEALKKESRKKSLTILNLLKRFEKSFDYPNEELYKALAESIDSAKKKDTKNVISCLSRIQLSLCELFSLPLEELVQGNLIEESELFRIVVLKSKKVEELEQKLAEHQRLTKSLEEAMAERLQSAKTKCDELKAASQEQRQSLERYIAECESLKKELFVKNKEFNEISKLLSAKSTALEFYYRARQELTSVVEEKNLQIKQLQQSVQELRKGYDTPNSEPEEHEDTDGEEPVEGNLKRRTHFTMKNSSSQTAFDAGDMDIEGERKSKNESLLLESIEKMKEEIDYLMGELGHKDKDISCLRCEIHELNAQLKEAEYHKSDFVNSDAVNIPSLPKDAIGSVTSDPLMVSPCQLQSEMTLPTYSQYWTDISCRSSFKPQQPSLQKKP